jgi:hypothetical protein
MLLMSIIEDYDLGAFSKSEVYILFAISLYYMSLFLSLLMDGEGT